MRAPTSLSEGQRRIETILDRLVVVYLAHTPEVPPQLRAQASASADRRYENSQRVVEEMLAVQDRDAQPRGSVAAEAEE